MRELLRQAIATVIETGELGSLEAMQMAIGKATPAQLVALYIIQVRIMHCCNTIESIHTRIVGALHRPTTRNSLTRQAPFTNEFVSHPKQPGDDAEMSMERRGILEKLQPSISARIQGLADEYKTLEAFYDAHPDEPADVATALRDVTVSVFSALQTSVLADLDAEDRPAFFRSGESMLEGAYKAPVPPTGTEFILYRLPSDEESRILKLHSKARVAQSNGDWDVRTGFKNRTAMDADVVKYIEDHVAANGTTRKLPYFP